MTQSAKVIVFSGREKREAQSRDNPNPDLVQVIVWRGDSTNIY